MRASSGKWRPYHSRTLSTRRFSCSISSSRPPTACRRWSSGHIPLRIRRFASSTIEACSSSRSYPNASGARNGGRSPVRLPPARPSRGPTTKRSSWRDRTSFSSSRAFQSSMRASRLAISAASLGNSFCCTTFPSSRRKDPNHVVTRSIFARRRRWVRKSVSASAAFLSRRFLLQGGSDSREAPELGRLHDPLLRDDPRDVLRGRHVERWVPRGTFLRRNRMAVQVEGLPWGSLPCVHLPPLHNP